jgi:hypothetical protein
MANSLIMASKGRTSYCGIKGRDKRQLKNTISKFRL